MALVPGARLGRRLSGPGLGRGHWTAAGRSRSRREAAEAEAEVPVFQYVGERAARADRVFVWGFSFSGALGVPTFVVPSSGPGPRAGARPPRRIQPVPYRLELDQKVRAAASSLPSSLAHSRPPSTYSVLFKKLALQGGQTSGRTTLELAASQGREGVRGGHQHLFGGSAKCCAGSCHSLCTH